jgi:hypothetical protein
MTDQQPLGCARCGHPSDWHRHDDEACSTHPQPCTPDAAPFRCLGYDCDASGYPGGTPETRCGCPAFVSEPRPHGPVSERFMRHHYGAPR